MNAEKLKQSIGAFFERKLSLFNNVEFELIKVNEVNSYFVGIALLDNPEDPVNLVFSTPINHQHFYFIISEASPEIFKSELALLQHYSECVSNLCKDHSIPSDSVHLNERGYAGYVLVSPATFHDRLDEVIIVDDTPIAGIGVGTATQFDLKLKREQGTDALYENWNTKGKDCLSF
ncbi:hypothetical protein FLL45_13585 [Aliikangiella marina]|uniref:Suppressor of fused domain protein n=1 Tax=Aliikangiella marina TaxID=1712262 RepID=A0A545T9J9_9GAMM|nr:hypothetical protein [Aliikangiella marina]TQV73891.1 hypothetical protein FLL45_13585 [Aliikangiella marina]